MKLTMSSATVLEEGRLYPLPIMYASTVAPTVVAAASAAVASGAVLMKSPKLCPATKVHVVASNKGL